MAEVHRFCGRGDVAMRCRAVPPARRLAAAGSAPVDVDSYERRNVIAKGMKRFDGISKFAPPQPAVERLSPRVISVLGCVQIPRVTVHFVACAITA